MEGYLKGDVFIERWNEALEKEQKKKEETNQGRNIRDGGEELTRGGSSGS